MPDSPYSPSQIETPPGPTPLTHALHPAGPDLPVDSDVDLHQPGQRAELERTPWPTLGAISAGGAIGALARYGAGVAFPAAPDGFPWATFGINVTGCLLIGVLMVMITEVRTVHPLTRPFLGVGVLGGFTTFSTYIVDIQRLVTAERPVTALAYLLGTLAAALTAVWLGITGTRALTGAGRPS
jgi:fluoride exporter